MVYKRLNKNKKNALVLESDNTFYPSYEVKASDVLEIWEYECNIGTTDKKQTLSETESIKDMFWELKSDIFEVKESIKK